MQSVVNIYQTTTTTLTTSTTPTTSTRAEHINNTTRALNRRTSAIRRIMAQIPSKNIIKIVQCLWMSKLRYGLQLCNRVRLSNSDPKNVSMNSLQVAQNKMLRMLNGSSLKDHIHTSSILQKFNLPAVNQLAAEIKITESWKILNTEDYPITFWPNEPMRQTTGMTVRATSIRDWKEDCSTKTGRSSFIIDAARLWNQIPTNIKTAISLNQAKKAIKKYCLTLPIDG